MSSASNRGDDTAAKVPSYEPTPPEKRMKHRRDALARDREARTPSAAIAPDSLAEHVSRELQEIGVEHSVKVKPRHQVVRDHEEQRIDYSIQGIARFNSVRDFAAALERAEADASYSAGSGWTFKRRPA